MDNNGGNDSSPDELRLREGTSESESGSSSTGGNQSLDTDRLTRPSSGGLPIRTVEYPGNSEDGPEEPSRAMSREALNTTSKTSGSHQDLQAEDQRTSESSATEYERMLNEEPQVEGDQPPTSPVEPETRESNVDTSEGQGPVVQSSSSAAQSLQVAFGAERNLVGRPTSTSGVPLHSGPVDDSAIYQSSSTILQVPVPTSPPMERRDGSDIVLPRWQPDAEVTYCPICRTQFSFFVRKHHCRKCGRVVCNSCSPHRITIPYQFIVQPPPTTPATTASQAGQSTSTRESESVLERQTGGMKVRLCNPCVPDPNTIPPQQPPNDVWREGAQPTYFLNSGNRGYAFGEAAMNNLERTSNSFARDSPARARGLSAASGLSSENRREQQVPGPYGGRTGTVIFNNTSNYSQYPNTQGGRYSNQTASHSSRPVSMIVPTQPNLGRGHTRGNQSLSFNPTSSAPNPNPQPHYRSLLDIDNQRTQPSNLDSRPLPAIPRIPEEDECPVCHRELPSRTMPNFEDARAEHITQCIEDQIAVHNGQSRPGAYTSQSQPALNPSGSSSDAHPQQVAQTPASSSTQHVFTRASASFQTVSLQPTVSVPAPIANTPEARMAAREAAHAAVVLRTSQSSSPSGDMGRRTGMFLYKASEKDCVDDAECTICLEEFEVGVGMARLECLCRFHAKCIREWFVDHPGRCPVHQHDGYGF